MGLVYLRHVPNAVELNTNVAFLRLGTLRYTRTRFDAAEAEHLAALSAKESASDVAPNCSRRYQFMFSPAGLSFRWPFL